MMEVLNVTETESDLFLLMLNLSQLRDSATIRRLFLEAMNERFQNISFSYCSEAKADSDLPIETIHSVFGSLRCKSRKSGSHISETDKIHIRNAARFLAVILENRKQAELKQALKEKDLLLKEIHHRVKNSLQLVSSLLDLQKDKLVAPEDSELLDNCKGRINSIARIHAQLYEHRNESLVTVQSYIEKLSREISLALGDQGCMIEIDSDASTLGIEQAIPFGLILNELLTNAIKYGISRIDDGDLSLIRVCFKKEQKRYRLSVFDPGKGFDFGECKHQSLGLHLISSLLQQIDGDIYTKKGDEHFCVDVTFPVI